MNVYTNIVLTAYDVIPSLKIIVGIFWKKNSKSFSQQISILNFVFSKIKTNKMLGQYFILCFTIALWNPTQYTKVCEHTKASI